MKKLSLITENCCCTTLIAHLLFISPFETLTIWTLQEENPREKDLKESWIQGSTAESTHLKVGDCAFEEVRLGLEISIKDCDKLIVLHIITAHGRLEVACLVTCAVGAMPVDDVDALLVPFCYLCLNQELYINIIWVIQYLHPHAMPWPIQLTDCCNGLLIYLCSKQNHSVTVKPSFLDPLQVSSGSFVQ